MSPEQARSPVEPSMVQPVEPEPPARLMPPAPTAPPMFRVVAVVLSRLKVVWLVVRSPPWMARSLVMVALPSEPDRLKTVAREFGS